MVLTVTIDKLYFSSFNQFSYGRKSVVYILYSQKIYLTSFASCSKPQEVGYSDSYSTDINLFSSR